MGFSLLTYIVDADLIFGKRAIIKAESQSEALAEASKRWGIPAKKLTARLYTSTHPKLEN